MCASVATYRSFIIWQGGKTVTWTSADQLATVTRPALRNDAIQVTIKNLVELEFTAETEERIAKNPDGKETASCKAWVMKCCPEGFTCLHFVSIERCSGKNRA